MSGETPPLLISAKLQGREEVGEGRREREEEEEGDTREQSISAKQE